MVYYEYMSGDNPEPTSEVVEELNIKHVRNAKPVEKKKYVVTEGAARKSTDESIGSEGIFKNGKVYKPGDEIELDEATAKNFIELGEVEDVSS